MATVHEDEGAAQADAICASNLGFYKRGVLATPQDRGGYLDLTRQRPDKGNLRRLQRRQVAIGKLRRLIGEHRTQSAKGGAPLMPASRNIDAVGVGASLKLVKERCEIHAVGLSDDKPRPQATLISGLQALTGRVSWAQRTSGRELVIYDWVNIFLQNGYAIPPDTISANLLVRILRAAVAEGANRAALLDAIRIDEARLRNPLNRLSAHLVLRIFAALERHFNDPAITLRIGEKASMQNFSDLGFATRMSTNLSTVIEANIRIQIMRQSMFQTVFEPAAKPPVLRWLVHPDNVETYASFVEFSVATYARLARQVLGEPPLLRRVEFQHAARFDPTRYEQVFGCPVHFSMPQTRMELAARQLFRPSPHANAVLLQAASKRYLQPAEWMAQGLRYTAHSYFYLSNGVDKSPPTLEKMASSFGMTERSLRRNLVNEGHPFRELLDRVRQDLCALYFIENKRSLGEIALLLGYSDLSAFTRAYKRWYGMPPSKA